MSDDGVVIGRIFKATTAPAGMPWMQALPHIMNETIKDAIQRSYALNGMDQEHMRHVRQFFRLLKKHQLDPHEF